jgi:hypothetical protein
LSCAFAVASIWVGIVAAYLISSLPPSTAIIGTAVAIYLAAFVASAIRPLRGISFRVTSSEGTS